MNVVLTAATENEISPAISWLKNSFSPVNVLVTGLGSTITAYNLTRYLLQNKPDLVIQAGIGGSFTGQYPPGSVMFVEQEVFADLGAIEENELIDVFDLGLAATNEQPFTNKWLINPNLAGWKKYNLPFVKSATINCISSTPEQVSRLVEKYNPDIEAMEGAALHFVCLKENVPFIQLRAVSNFVGERNKRNWKMKEAIEKLNEQLKIIINDL